MSKPIIAIDIDDVLADSTEALRQVVNEKYGLSLEPHHYKVPGDYHKYYERVWESHGYGHVVLKGELNDNMVADQSHVSPYAEAAGVLQELTRRYEFVVVSARNPSWLPATEQWIAVNYPGIFSQIIFAGQHDNPDGKTKGDMCVELGATWLIDDNISHCQTAIDRGVGAILFGEYGWHQDVPERMIRCKKWKDIQKFFDEQRL